MNENLKYIGENVRAARKRKGLTLEQLAELCGISESFLGIAERGNSGFSIETIIKIATILEVTTDELIMPNSVKNLNDVSKIETLQTLLNNSEEFDLEFFIDFVKLHKNYQKKLN